MSRGHAGCYDRGMPSFAELADCRLAYERRGSGPSFVFIHGFGLDRRLWEPQFAHLAGRADLLRYDCRGFGESSGALEGDYRHGADLVALLDHQGIERATLVGMSMGGQIALETAVLHPERVERLILIDSFLADFEFSEAWQGMWRALRQLARSQGLEAAKETWREGMLFSMEDRFPPAAEALRAMMDDWSGWHLGHPEHYPYRSISHRLAEIAVPALVAVGELDLPDFHAIAKRIAASVPRAQHAVIPLAGHVPSLETPQAFHRAVDAFLDGDTESGPNAPDSSESGPGRRGLASRNGAVPIPRNRVRLVLTPYRRLRDQEDDRDDRRGPEDDLHLAVREVDVAPALLLEAARGALGVCEGRALGFREGCQIIQHPGPLRFEPSMGLWGLCGLGRELERRLGVEAAPARGRGTWGGQSRAAVRVRILVGNWTSMGSFGYEAWPA